MLSFASYCYSYTDLKKEVHKDGHGCGESSWGIKLTEDVDHTWANVSIDDVLGVSLIKLFAQFDQLSN